MLLEVICFLLLSWNWPGKGKAVENGIFYLLQITNTNPATAILHSGFGPDHHVRHPHHWAACAICTSVPFYSGHNRFMIIMACLSRFVLGGLGGALDISFLWFCGCGRPVEILRLSLTRHSIPSRYIYWCLNCFMHHFISREIFVLYGIVCSMKEQNYAIDKA